MVSIDVPSLNVLNIFPQLEMFDVVKSNKMAVACQVNPEFLAGAISALPLSFKHQSLQNTLYCTGSTKCFWQPLDMYC